MIRALLFLLLLFRPCLAVVTESPNFISGFDGTDKSTTDTDSFEFVESGTGGTDSRVDLQRTRVHNAANGGDDSSLWAGESLITSAATSGYYVACIPTTTGTCSDINPHFATLSVGASFNIDTPPAASTSRTILAIRETTGTDYGCSVAIDNNRQLTLFYGSGTSTTPPCGAGFTAQGGQCWPSWGTAGLKLWKNSCTNFPLSGCNVSGDCPSGTCSSTTFYWAGVEVVELIQDPSNVECDLYIDGVPYFTGTVKTIAGTTPVQAMGNAAVGVVDGPGTVNGTATVFFDDYVLDDTSRAGFGYVARKVPATKGNPIEWSNQSCSDYVSCVNDYNTGPNFVYGSNDASNLINTAKTLKQATFATTIPDLGLPSKATVTAIEGVAFGNTSSGNALRDMQSILFFGTDAFESDGPVQTLLASGSRTTPSIWQRYIVTLSPVTGFTLSQLMNNLGHAVKSGPSLADTLRVGALLEYVRVRRPDPIGPPTLLDHNGDGKVSVMVIGDSTLTGVHQQSCVGGTQEGQTCNAVDYCSWDSVNRGKPTGGCNGNNAMCKTCLLNREAAHSGAGFPCVGTVPTGCLFTCNGTTHLCENADGPTTISCVTAANCDFGDGDGVDEVTDCDSGATCVQSCPGGGNCPTGRVGWATTLAQNLNVDVLVTCGQDGEQISQMYVNRFASLRNGDHSSCEALSGTGVCTCVNPTDCAAAGGTCAGGVCTVGDVVKLNCIKTSDCATNQHCKFPAPDLMATLEGFNEIQTCGNVGCITIVGGNSTNCDNANGWFRPTGCPTDGSGVFQKTPTTCTKDSECSSVSPQSQCGGWCLSGIDAACQTTEGFCTGFCSTSTHPCGTEYPCQNFFGPFGQGTQCVGGANPILPTQKPGLCWCTADADCAANFKCVGDVGNSTGLCRRSCTVDGDCNTGRSSACVTFSGGAGSIGNGVKVCQGRCTLPCDAITCTKDQDCAPVGGSAVTGRWGGMTEARWTGTCNKARGRCTNCGPTMCLGDQVQSPCTCTSSGECPSGTCTNNICVGGTRANCHSDLECASGRQCLYPAEQYNKQHPYHHLPVKIAHLMQEQLDAAHSGTVLVFVPPPQLSGNSSALGPLKDRQCDAGSSILLFYDRDYIAQTRLDYLNAGPWLPQRHVIDVEPAWSSGKTAQLYHADIVHFYTPGAILISDMTLAGLNKLNACLKPSGDPQLYCYQPGTNAFRPSGCSLTACVCTTKADCPSSTDLCVRRPCGSIISGKYVGDETNCPDASDTCGPE